MSAGGCWKRMYFMTPTFFPIGGTVKIFDYVNHAISLGYEPVIACPERYKPGLPLFQIPRFSGISPENGIRFTGPDQVSVGPHDLAFVSWPTDFKVLESRLSRWARHGQVIVIVQNVRWKNPDFENGFAVRLLSRPMAWILTNDVVLEAVRPYLNTSLMAESIQIGHESRFFEKRRTSSIEGPVKVGYTTWKSDVGDRVAGMLKGDSEFEFRAIRGAVGWNELRNLYHWSDVFLSTPHIEEGFYLPGLEAMASGAVVISPDAGGNRAYCEFGKNCVEVDFESPWSYAEALRSLRAADAGEIESLRRASYETVGRHTLESERRGFGEFMGRLVEHLDHPEPLSSDVARDKS